MDFGKIVGIVLLISAVSGLLVLVGELREKQNKKQAEAKKPVQPMEPPKQSKQEEKKPLSEQTKQQEKQIPAQEKPAEKKEEPTARKEVLDYYLGLNELIHEFKMCAYYTNREPEERRCNKIIDQLNKIHKVLTYEGIEEPEYTTVIEREYWVNDLGCDVDKNVIQLHYDENGILRKKVGICDIIPLLSRDRIPEDHCLLDITLYDEKGEYVRNCGYPRIINSEHLEIKRHTIRDREYCCETFCITVDNLFSEKSCYEPVKRTQDMDQWLAAERSTKLYRTMEWWCDTKNDDRVYVERLRGISYRVVRCDDWKYSGQAWIPEPQDPFTGECGDGMTWRKEGGTLYIEGQGEIEAYAFWWDDSIQKVVIAPGCTGIGDGAFASCEQLQEVELPEGLLSIGDEVFLDCEDLREINLPEGLQEIGANAFSLCENLKLQIPDSVTEIGESAFQSVQEICYLGPEWSDNNWGADQWVDKVLRGTCEPGTWTIRDNTLYVHIKGELPLEKFEKHSWHPHVSETVIRSPWYPYEGRFEHAVIFPGCTKIKTESFQFSAIKTISIPSTVTEIESHAFDQCHNLQSVVLPEGITEVVDDMFYLCENLTSVEIPDSVTRIGNYAFCGCRNLRSVKLPQNLTVIGHGAFSGCTQLTALKIPEGVMEIGGDAFKNCSQLASVTIPAGVTRIGHSAFEGLSCAADIQVDEKNSNIVNIDGVLIDQARGILLTCLREKIGRYVIPDGITEIGDCAFIDQKNLTDIVIPEGVMEIGFRAFGGCEGLTSVEIPGSVTKIEDFTFSECTGLVSAVLREGVREIGMDAFCGCTGLTRVEIPESLTKIGGCAFERCDNLVSVRIPSGVTVLQSTAFGGLSALKEIQVDENNACFASLDGVLFDKNLQKLICFPGGKTDRYVIPGSVTRIGSYAFGDCRRLKSVTIPDSVTTVEMRAFLNCSGLETLIVPDSVMDIWNQAFFGIPHIIYNGPDQSKDNWGAVSRN